ncbi:N-acetyltransferase [Streptomyces sp. NPDC046977]|uniref:N-acetyltransferase n=1 Tax=Streptomyces sp. NPDC046977 TaxID=3154703 RepID=UPI0033E65610
MGPLLPLPGICAYGRHVLWTEQFLFHTPETALDIAALLAAAADPEAQHFVGMPENAATVPLADDRIREAILNLRPGDPASLRAAPWTRELLAIPFDIKGEGEYLVAVRRDDGRYAGCMQLHPVLRQISGWLAPHTRTVEMETELYRAAALLAHTHFGFQTIGAGYEVASPDGAQAFAAAGFVSVDGPATFTLENGREVEPRWVQHVAEGPTSRCRGYRPSAPSTSEAGETSESP